MVCFAIGLEAQPDGVNRFAIFFADKADSPYSIDNPEAFLSHRAIERRAKQNIAITEEDFPVNPHYIDSLNQLGIFVHYTSRWLNAAIVQDQTDIINTLQEKSYIDSIAYIAKGDRITSAGSTFDWPDSFNPPGSTNLSSDDQNRMLAVQEMHEDGFKGEGMLVAIFDGGFDGLNESAVFQHLFTNNQLIDYHDFVINGKDIFRYDDHGTSVFTPIGAYHDSIYQGIAYEADFALYVTEDIASEYRIEEFNWVLAAERSDSIGADVINSSVGYNTFTDESMDYEYEDLDGQTSVASIGASMAAQRGMIVVTSAGNEGNKSWQYITVPADGKDVVAVGAVTANGSLASYSSTGPTADGRIKPVFTAKGSPTVVLSGSGNFYNGIGTSYAAPQIAGLAASFWQSKPELSALEVIEALKASADRYTSPGNRYGYGTPNYQRAVNGTILSVRDVVEDRVTVYPNPFRDNRFYVALDAKLDKEALTFTLIDLKGGTVPNVVVRYINPELVEIQTEALASGNYYLQIATDQIQKAVKLIKY